MFVIIGLVEGIQRPFMYRYVLVAKAGFKRPRGLAQLGIVVDRGEVRTRVTKGMGVRLEARPATNINNLQPVTALWVKQALVRNKATQQSHQAKIAQGRGWPHSEVIVVVGQRCFLKLSILAQEIGFRGFWGSGR